MFKRKDGRWCEKLEIKGELKYFYSSQPVQKAALKDILMQVAEYEKKCQYSLTFESIADKWNSEYREKISDINYRKNTRCAYNRIIEHFTDTPIEQIGAPEINAFIKKLIKKGYSQKTVASHKNILNMILVYALCEGYIRYNPVPDIKIPSGLPKTPRQMPETESIKIIEQHYEGFELFPFFLLFTGLRKSEALAITRDDIDFKNKIIKVRNHVIHDGNRPVYEPVLKTENAERDVILLDRLASVIPKNFKGFLFSMAGDGVKPLTHSAYNKRWEKYCKTYGVKITAHMLRHGYATMLFEAGIDEKDAQELMGHSDIKLTRDTYTHIRTKRKKETADKLNGFSF